MFIFHFQLKDQVYHQNKDDVMREVLFFSIKTSIKINQKQILFPLLTLAMKLIMKRQPPYHFSATK